MQDESYLPNAAKIHSRSAVVLLNLIIILDSDIFKQQGTQYCGMLKIRASANSVKLGPGNSIIGSSLCHDLTSGLHTEDIVV